MKQGMGIWWDSFVSCGNNKINVFVPGNARSCRSQGRSDLLSEVLGKES